MNMTSLTTPLPSPPSRPDFRALNRELDAQENGGDATTRTTTTPQERHQQLQEYWKLVQDHPNDAYALLLKARILLLLRKPPQYALGTLQRAMSVDGTCFAAMTQAGLLLRLTNRPHEALRLLLRAEEVARESYETGRATHNVDAVNATTGRHVATCAADVASLLQHLGNVEGAQAALERARAADDTYLPIYRALAGLYQKQKWHERAHQSLQQGIDQCTIGRGMGQKRSAAANTKAERLAFLLHAGTLYGRWNEWKKALPVLQQALDMTSANDEAQQQWHILSKQIQAHQALHDREARDEVIAKLYALHKAGKVPSQKYCREMIASSAGFILAWEWFEESYEFGKALLAMKWEQAPPQTKINTDDNDDDAEQPLPIVVSLGSYEETNQMDRQMGKLQADQRLYHVDKYGANGSHGTLAMLRASQRPTYDMIRPLLLAGMVNQDQAPQLKALNAQSMVPETGEAGVTESLN